VTQGWAGKSRYLANCRIAIFLHRARNLTDRAAVTKKHALSAQTVDLFLDRHLDGWLESAFGFASRATSYDTNHTVDSALPTYYTLRMPPSSRGFCFLMKPHRNERTDFVSDIPAFALLE